MGSAQAKFGRVLQTFPKRASTGASMNSPNDTELTKDDRLKILERCCRVQVAGTGSQVANQASLNYLLRFAYGCESNIGFVSGAFKTLGLRTDTAGLIVKQIRNSVLACHDQETALNAILESVGIRCQHLQDFPTRPDGSAEAVSYTHLRAHETM
jgi:hypothetical protein